MDADWHVELLRFGIEWKIIGIAEMTPFYIWKNRGADHAEFLDAAA